MDVFKKINRERNIKGTVAGLRATGIVLCAGLLLKSVFLFTEIYLAGFDFCTVISCVIIFIVVFFLCRESRNKAAARLDSVTASDNRLEGMVELENSSHPLKVAQTRECLDFFNKNTLSLRLARLILPAVIVIALFCSFISVPDYRRPEEKGSDKKLALTNTEKQKNEKIKKIEDLAEVALTAPEPEMRSKPMDEIEFEGSASSSCGFGEISLKISVNAVLKKTIKIECDSMDKPGKLNFSGAFYLDELDVNPFDLVIYHLEAYSSNDKEKVAPVLSIPQFIEVRPFREDAFLGGKGDMGNMSGKLAKHKMLLEMLIKFLNNQIDLNKSSYLAKSGVNRIENKVLAQELCAVASAQGALYDEIIECITEIDPKIIPANTFYSIKQAAENMRQAQGQLEKITKSFDKDIQFEKKEK